MLGDLQIDYITVSLQILSSDRTLACHLELLQDKTLLENMSDIALKETELYNYRWITYPDFIETTGSERGYPERAQIVTDIKVLVIYILLRNI